MKYQLSLIDTSSGVLVVCLLAAGCGTQSAASHAASDAPVAAIAPRERLLHPLQLHPPPSPLSLSLRLQSPRSRHRLRPQPMTTRPNRR